MLENITSVHQKENLITARHGLGGPRQLRLYGSAARPGPRQAVRIDRDPVVKGQLAALPRGAVFRNQEAGGYSPS